MELCPFLAKPHRGRSEPDRPVQPPTVKQVYREGSLNPHQRHRNFP